MALTTTTQIKALPPKADRYDVSVSSEDDEGRQVPGLQVRVFPSGAKAFQFRYPFSGTVRRMSLGPCDSVSLKLARERHVTAARLLGRGIDPQDHQDEQREAAAKEKARREAEVTVESLVDEFITDYIREHRQDPDQAERLLKGEIVAKWKDRKANELKRRDAVVLVRAIKRRAPVLANRVAALIVQLFGFAADAGHLETNPMAGLRRPSKEVPRERKLDVEEIPILWKGLDERSSAQPRGNLKKGSKARRGSTEHPWMSRPLALGLKILLVTAQRRGELLGAQWSQIDFDAKRWVIPKEIAKNGKEHPVPLSSLAIELLKDLQTLAGDSAFLFPTAHSQRLGDTAMTGKALTRAAARNQCGLEHWTAHDLRRTAASHMNRIGVDAIVVEKVLNHTLPRMMQTYNRHDYEAEMRDALDRWAAELRKIIAGQSNIVAMPKQRARA